VLDASLSLRVILGGLAISNGLAWTEDGRTLYIVDSGKRVIRVLGYDIDEGTITAERAPIEVPRTADGAPDGLTIDAEGCLWVAMYGAGIVRRYTPQGRPDALVTVPVTGVTSCVFGGPSLADLYITTSPYSLSADDRLRQPEAGGVFVCRPGVPGRPEPCFVG
jgi:sugar lactone lactonase YvrE